MTQNSEEAKRTARELCEGVEKKVIALNERHEIKEEQTGKRLPQMEESAPEGVIAALQRFHYDTALSALVEQYGGGSSSDGGDGSSSSSSASGGGRKKPKAAKRE